jgi:hypothetical protein
MLRKRSLLAGLLLFSSCIVPAPSGEERGTPANAHAPGAASPSQPAVQMLNANFGDKVVLRGAQIAPAHLSPSEQTVVTLVFQVSANMTEDEQIFVHVVDAQSGAQLGNLDHIPSSGATSTWHAGESKQDVFQVTLPQGASPQAVFLGLGLWNPRTDQRLELKNKDQVRNDGNNRVFIGPIPVG